MTLVVRERCGWTVLARNEDWGNSMRDERMRRDELRLNDEGGGE